MLEGCDRDHEDRPGGSSKPLGMRSRMLEVQSSKYSLSAQTTDTTLQINTGYRYTLSIQVIDLNTEGDAEDVNKASLLHEKIEKKILTPPATKIDLISLASDENTAS